MASLKNILVVDDEPDLVDLVSYNLKKEGYSIDSASDAESAIVKMRNTGYDLLILDLMLPGMQGIELCRLLREDPKTSVLPIIILTAKGDEVDRILGLEIGADDYMTKPFSPRELVARIKALLRRSSKKPPSEEIIKIGDLEISTERYRVSIKGNPVPLTSTEFKILLFLAERRGKVITRNQLLDAVWHDDEAVEQRKVDVHIRRLRYAIEKDPSNPEYIKTLRGIGYYFEQNIMPGY
jgi:phosphate regulon transcriptional regulator PhoB